MGGICEGVGRAPVRLVKRHCVQLGGRSVWHSGSLRPLSRDVVVELEMLADTDAYRTLDGYVTVD